MGFSLRVPLLLICGLLAACSGVASGPVSSGVTYELPPDPGVRICINQCSEARNFCNQNCNLDYRRCSNEVQAKALLDYNKYTRDQFAAHAPIELRASDFERMEPCTRENQMCTDDCDGHYKICYQGCGGIVHETTSCQYLCF